LLNDSLEKVLTLVSAPAGYGKTSLLASWLRETRIASAWLSLDKRDNDSIHFLQYFLTAIHQIVPTVGLDLLDMLQGIQPPPYEALLSLVINDIDKNSVPCVLVLDDFHVIEAQSILEMLVFLLDHMPPALHLVLLSRTDPPIPLSRLRVRNQLLNIRADQLRFTLDEIALFLNDLMRLELTAPDIAAMEARTEGWIAGLQLAALPMQSCQDIHGFVSAFTGSHYYIMDYLAEEVLKHQPNMVSDFLLQTSILDRMCAPLCDTVMKADTTGSVDSQAMLESLEQMNLFVISLDGERRWYRYHHLFTDVLNRRLEHLYPNQLPELHRRASEWYEQNQLIPEAIHHALEAGNLDRAARRLH
jgi:LuxR family maltose regulon positive regulatory protein